MSKQYLDVFEKFVPQEAAAYCLTLYEHFGFAFKIKKERLTKLGDYRFEPQTNQHIISINNNLNPYAFLITYLHEVAHLVTFKEHKNKVNPHGEEWKNNFKRVVRPVLNNSVFDQSVLLSLTNYFRNPKASSCSDPILYQVLKKFDQPNGKVMLSALDIGDAFIFNKKEYKYIEKKRTRVLVQNIDSKRKYLISQLAEVKKLL